MLDGKSSQASTSSSFLSAILVVDFGPRARCTASLSEISRAIIVAIALGRATLAGMALTEKLQLAMSSVYRKIGRVSIKSHEGSQNVLFLLGNASERYSIEHLESVA